MMLAIAKVWKKERRTLAHSRQVFQMRFFPDKSRVILMKAFHKRIALRVLKGREDRLNAHIQGQTHDLPKHARVCVAAIETTFVVHLEIV